MLRIVSSIAAVLLCTQLHASSFCITKESKKENPPVPHPEPKPCCPVEPKPCCTKAECIFVSAEFLYWKTQSAPEPVPLVITGPGPVPVLGASGTKVVLGGGSVGIPWHPGARFAIGAKLDKCFEFDANFYFLTMTTRRECVRSTGLPGSPILAAPFFNVVTSTESATLIASSLASPPFSGKAVLSISNWSKGAEFNLVSSISNICTCNLDILTGLRYWNFDEKLSFFASSPYVTIPDIFQTKDRFQTFNNFIGGQVGFNTDICCKCFSASLSGKLALGANLAKSKISGFLLTNDFNGFNAPQGFVGGIFAQLTNIGKRKYTLFSVIPEISVNVNYRFKDCGAVRLGYTFLYATNVLRPGNTIDHRINPTQSAAISFTATPALHGPAYPVPLHKLTSMWIQGLNIGLLLTF